MIKNRKRRGMESQTGNQNPGHLVGANCSFHKHSINIHFFKEGLTAAGASNLDLPLRNCPVDSFREGLDCRGGFEPDGSTDALLIPI